MISEGLAYHTNDEAFEGVIVYPANAGPFPGLLLAPNWLGITSDAIERAEWFASRGYAVLIVDLHGRDDLAAAMEDIEMRAARVRATPERTRQVMAAAGHALKKKKIVDNRPLSAVGFCLGGGAALEFARSGADLGAAVSIHGDLRTTLHAKEGAVQAHLLVLHGSADPVVPKADRDAFENEMTAAGADWSMMTFGNRVHAFTDSNVDKPPVAKFDAFASTWAYMMADQFIRGTHGVGR